MVGETSALGLFTDLYELTMAQGYLLSGKGDEPALFDYFFRSVPFEGGYVVFAGLGDLIERMGRMRFSEEDLAYLKTLGFEDVFLEWLGAFRFGGTVRAMREGEIIFPLEPVARVEGTIMEAQLLEPLLLNALNFQSLVATKAARVGEASQGRAFYEFGLRRAQGSGAMEASRAAAVGGAAGTSNTLAGSRYGIEVGGTQAHSWVQHFGDELESFRAYAGLYPQACVLLVDTYDTLKSGVPNAIKVGLEMKSRGESLVAIRLDSGDLAYLSKRARALLDEAGLKDVAIYATNQLDEHLIKSLLDQGAPIDLFGVGTRLVTGHPDGALDGVYKLSEARGDACLKISDNFTKVSLPGRKSVWRYYQGDGTFYGDGIGLESGGAPDRIHHPYFPDQSSDVSEMRREELLSDVFVDGVLVRPGRSVQESAAYMKGRLALLPDEHRRFANPHTYKVGASEDLLELRSRLYAEAKAKASLA